MIGAELSRARLTVNGRPLLFRAWITIGWEITRPLLRERERMIHVSLVLFGHWWQLRLFRREIEGAT